jgi:hypothetical protein
MSKAAFVTVSDIQRWFIAALKKQSSFRFDRASGNGVE